jgi:hypothetical protein
MPIVQVAGWASGLVWMDPENVASTGGQTSDHPAHSKLLYWQQKIIVYLYPLP